ncbi:MAG: hemolysin III family protein [Actinobacteria bacterium]|nr:hemolysin III family protein [Actinomycetota bacterium]
MSSFTIERPRLRGWLHALAVPVALAAAVVLWRSAASMTLGGRVTALVFGASLVGLYSVSSLYHVPSWSARARRILSRCDGAMIQIMIAGTFTPIAFHTLTGAWRVVSLLVAWLVAIVGATIALSPLEAPRWLGTLGAASAGWLLVVPLAKIMTALPWQGNGLILLGGALYTIGAIVYGMRRPNPIPDWFGFHEVFHVLVVAASTAHYLAIWRYVLPA